MEKDGAKIFGFVMKGRWGNDVSFRFHKGRDQDRDFYYLEGETAEGGCAIGRITGDCPTCVQNLLKAFQKVSVEELCQEIDQAILDRGLDPEDQCKALNPEGLDHEQADEE